MRWPTACRPKPALVCTGAGGAAIAWKSTSSTWAAFGSFVAEVPAPLRHRNGKTFQTHQRPRVSFARAARADGQRTSPPGALAGLYRGEMYAATTPAPYADAAQAGPQPGTRLGAMTCWHGCARRAETARAPAVAAVLEDRAALARDKKAARGPNEAKTLFLASSSHEIRSRSMRTTASLAARTSDQGATGCRAGKGHPPQRGNTCRISSKACSTSRRSKAVR